MDKFTPLIFTKPGDGRTHRRTASTAAEAVKLRFDGWKEEKEETAKPAKAETKADAKAEQKTKDSTEK